MCCNGNVHVLYWECACAVMEMCMCCTWNVRVLYWECVCTVLGMCLHRGCPFLNTRPVNVQI